jgi:hypothetical protein
MLVESMGTVIGLVRLDWKCEVRVFGRRYEDG